MTGKLIVSKFGGTSMGDTTCMSRSAQIVLEQKSAITVVSATSGTTNDLIQLGKSAEANLAWSEIELLLKKIHSRHQQMAQELHLHAPLQQQLQLQFEEMHSLAKGIHLLKDCSLKAMDAMMSLGERMSSVLFTGALQNEINQRNTGQEALLLDVRHFLITDDQFSKAKPNISAIFEKCQALKAEIKSPAFNKVYVTQGFIGQSGSGSTTTLGRGGSDYSAALLAEGIGADVVEIWTDVAGIATTDPRICKKAQVIPEISFKEASELAIFGAKVLHPATLLPAMRQDIPVFVGSSFAPKEKGTWIRRKVDGAPIIRAMALRTKQVLVTLTTPDMLNAHGFLFQIFKIFNEHKVSVDAITTSEISVALTVDEPTLTNKKLFQDLGEIAEVSVEEKMTLVSLIGNNINHTSGIGKKIFDSIEGINVRMICLGASHHNYCFLVNEEKGPETIQRLHRTFIESPT